MTKQQILELLNSNLSNELKAEIIYKWQSNSNQVYTVSGFGSYDSIGKTMPLSVDKV